MFPAKRGWSGCKTEADGVAQLEPKWDPLPPQEASEMAAEPPVLAEAAGVGGGLFPPSFDLLLFTLSLPFFFLLNF